ncbi:MAG: M15 family metallopeptidase [Erysipelotrichales bacterium]|nr:M15 family metallopeptidase [Erysipelotrichales bacterium]
MAKKKKKLSYFQRLILTYKIRIKRFIANQKKNSKKYKISSNVKLLAASFVLIIILGFVLKTSYSNYRISTQTKLGYSKEQAEYILENKLTNITKEYGYSNFFITSHMQGKYDEQYIELYFYLKEFKENTKLFYDKLTAKGYSKEELKEILTALTEDDDIIPLLIYDKQENIQTYINDVERGKLTKNYLNIYENAEIVDVVANDTIINKKIGLSENYVPENLKSISTYCAFYPGQLVEKAATSFNNMCMDAKEQGIYFASMVAYRSYADQQSIYDSYADNYGLLQVDEYTPKAGFSEHQTGLALNVSSMAANPEGTTFVETNEYEWLVNNAAKYGFIFRYPKNKEHITGFAYEASHLRYVGIEMAEAINETGLTMEEFFVLYQ